MSTLTPALSVFLPGQEIEGRIVSPAWREHSSVNDVSDNMLCASLGI